MTTASASNHTVARLCLWLLRFSFRRWRGLLAVLGVLVLRVGFDVLRPWPMKIIVDHTLQGQPMPGFLSRLFASLGAHDPMSILTIAVVATIILFLAGWALNLLAAYAGLGFGQRLVFDLASRLFGHLQRLSLLFHTRSSVGDNLRRVTVDCACVSTIVQGAILPVITAVISLAAMFAILWPLDPVLTLLSLGVAPLMLFALKRYAQPMADLAYRQQEAEARVYEVIERTLGHVQAVQCFGREADADAQFRRSTDTTLAATFALYNVQLRFKILIGLATTLGTVAIMGLGAHQVLTGKLTVGGMLVFLSYLSSLYGPLEALAYSSSAVQGASGSARRVLEILESPPDVTEAPDARHPNPDPARGHIRLDSVTFGYDPTRPVLHNITLEARPGQVVALVGPTGAGKSTLASLVLRLIDPQSGAVTLDGQDLRSLKLADFRRQVALVPQEPLLLPGTIAENIAYGRPDASREQIIDAAQAAGAAEFIEKMGQGYDSPVGERGATLSGGQRQRVAIARALLRGASMLVLDEPTSALDASTETLILASIRSLKEQGKTVIVIAHRLSAAREADQILVLQNGAIAESGTHGELLARPGLYSTLYNLQFGHHP